MVDRYDLFAYFLYVSSLIPFSADLMVNQTWYTDSNGRDMQQRRFNYRPTWHLIVTDPFAR